jgi:hypothetical protein
MKLKKLIRKSVFETNSSTCHSLVINRNGVDSVYSRLYPNENGVVEIYCGYYFGRGNTIRINDPERKAAFLMVGCHRSGWNFNTDSDRIKELVIEAIKKNSMADEVVFDCLEDGFIEFTSDFDVEDNEDFIYNFIFDKNTFLFLQGDEYDEDEDLYNNLPKYKE